MYKPDPERVKEFWTTLQDLWLALFGSKVPTAAAINVSTYYFYSMPLSDAKASSSLYLTGNAAKG